MGAGKTTLGAQVAERLGRRFVDLDHELECQLRTTLPQLFAERGEAEFRILETAATAEVLRDRKPAVVALGGGAIGAEPVRRALAEHALSVLIEVEPDEAWERVRREGRDRPLARELADFRALHARRRPLYERAAQARARDVDGVVLAAGGVHVGTGSLELLGELVPGDREVALVSDTHVAGIHGATAQLALGGRLASTHELPAGETAKDVAVCERLWRRLELERGDTIVALGGGCTTDVAGFVAATYLRGVDWAAVPTSLVGQVDAALGGKTAIDLPEGKNLVGAFHWPVRTVVDPRLLETLPARERAAGLAEVVKTGLLDGRPLWELPDAALVRSCAAFKTALCLRDPSDRGPRRALNLGHTFAHALEAAAGYEGLGHGEAVALGLLAATRLSVRHLGLDPAVPAQVEELLGPRPVAVDVEAAWRALRRDKKAEGGWPRLVLLEAPGKPVLDFELPEAEVRAALGELVGG